MANKISIQVAGGEVKNYDGVVTVKDAKIKANAEAYTATVNGDPADDDQVLEDFEFVALSKPVKAG